MSEYCENCKYYYKLKHNFRVGKGFAESHCCVLYYEDPNGWVQEVKPEGRCEMFVKKEQR